MQRWIAEARAGSPEAMAQIAETFRAYLLHVADREMDPRLRAKLGASDVVQETLLRAQQGFDQFQDDSKAELLAWMRRLLKNYLIDVRRTYSTDKRAVDREQPANGSSTWKRFVNAPVTDATPSKSAAASEEAQQLQQAIEQLPDHYREVIRLCSWEQLSFAEVAVRMDRSPEAIRKLWGRALADLERALARVGNL